MKEIGQDKVWKLKEKAVEFRGKVEELRTNNQVARGIVEQEWKEMSKIMKEAATSVCGMTKRGTKLEKETWWCNDEVQRALKEKRKAYKNLRTFTQEWAVLEYKKWKKEAKRTVAKTKEAAWKEWYEHLEAKEREETIYKIVKTRAKQRRK